MKANKALLLICLLLGLALAQQISTEEDPHLLNYLKKGMTFQTQQWPIQSNNWAGRMGCKGCNPQEGDTPCTNSLPALCILHHKVIDRPFYDYSPNIVPFQNPDRGYYNGWTGGIFTVTPPVRGYDIDSYQTGNKLCQKYWGKNAKFAQFHDGFYMNYMQNLPRKTWKFWSWKVAKCGGWSYWGYFNHKYSGRAWTWINTEPHSNCGPI